MLAALNFARPLIAQFMLPVLSSVFGKSGAAVLSGKKTDVGLWSVALGVAMYFAEANGITAMAIEPGTGIDSMLSWAQAGLVNGGGVLATFGIGDRMGKQSQAMGGASDDPHQSEGNWGEDH